MVEVRLNSLLASCLLMSHLPKQVPWLSQPLGRERDSILNKRRGKVTLQIDKHTAVRRLCGHESNQPHSLMLLG